jgi:hypothetical protein
MCFVSWMAPEWRQHDWPADTVRRSSGMPPGAVVSRVELLAAAGYGPERPRPGPPKRAASVDFTAMIGFRVPSCTPLDAIDIPLRVFGVAQLDIKRS